MGKGEWRISTHTWEEKKRSQGGEISAPEQERSKGIPKKKGTRHNIPKIHIKTTAPQNFSLMI